MLNKDIVDKVCAALRSGKYKQGSLSLRYENKFCCLGVMCDVYDPAGWATDAESSVSPVPYGSNSGTGYLPKEVIDWIGSAPGRTDGWIPSLRMSLAQLNDGDHRDINIPLKNKETIVLRHQEKADFNQIADILESYWEAM